MTAIVPAGTDGVAGSQPVRAGARRPLWTAIARYPVAAVAGLCLAALVLAALVAPLIAPGDPQYQDLSSVLSGPSGAHWLGTDRLGRDVLSRLLFGTQVTLLDVAIATAVFLALGVPLGVVAGYRGAWLDRVVVRFADLVLAVPGIIVLLMVVAVFPGDDVATMIALGVIGCPGLLRIVRGSTLAIRGELYVKAARLSGLRTGAILRRHVLPRVAGPIIVQTSLFCATALLAESGLSFLGLTRPDTRGPSWGNMVAEASNAMSRTTWLLVPTGGALILTVMAFGLIGDAVRDATTSRSVAVAPLSRRRRRGPKATPSAPPVSSVSAADTPILRVDGLTVTLGGSPLVQDVGFVLAAGEAVGIVGESGCGKSVTAKAVLGLLPAGADVAAGSITFEGKELTALSDKELGRVRGSGIAFISQDPANSLDPTFTIGSQLREVIRRHHPQRRRQADAEAERLLRLVQLPDPRGVLRRRPGELSGGMAQRVCIAMALAARPKVLIADEPTTALDVTVQAEILALLRDLQHRLGMALMLITHDWGVLADVCDRAVVMYAGQVVESASVEELYARPRHPYTAALLAANPHRAPRDQPLPSIPGAVPRPGHWPEGCHFQPRCALAQPACGEGPIALTPAAPRHLSRCIRVERMEHR
ncbi:dipeptide/oligopeptide/nickel ABC transporter permease/ATP-binding protein [Amycolatopsis rhizosphaerae]|uniref:Dipeptide/oligopeptide/nickel ABC transporter permease/ATP-binding protein n=1 Tax=Amycolatopsis rhizosphaerae TaxID=2053003 RepID=A0A558C9Y8_9PSEU|nr:dipeptide/oligopeptide/nickel ABC transporter permease/ATP-binding protein [Amycolatopsis rhizosphaerae]TVT45598.1 dipeptide/oligopeptide/nickel ABC transporter permease/ATP-binding protein [Amycolatopsis rhizosphaerae]